MKGERPDMEYLFECVITAANHYSNSIAIQTFVQNQQKPMNYHYLSLVKNIVFFLQRL